MGHSLVTDKGSAAAGLAAAAAAAATAAATAAGSRSGRHASRYAPINGRGGLTWQPRGNPGARGWPLHDALPHPNPGPLSPTQFMRTPVRARSLLIAMLLCLLQLAKYQPPWVAWVPLAPATLSGNVKLYASCM